jgi:hypothetical protein
LNHHLLSDPMMGVQLEHVGSGRPHSADNVYHSSHDMLHANMFESIPMAPNHMSPHMSPHMGAGDWPDLTILPQLVLACFGSPCW